MAYDKIIVIHSRLDHCLDYTLNEEKTNLKNALDYGMNPAKARLVTGINCDAENAHREMQMTKRRWDKRGGILGYHIVHSFAPGEVTPEEAHEAGVEFARRLLGEDSFFFLLSSGLGGALLLAVCDLLARLLFAPFELPLGVVLSLTGGPFFIWLLLRQRRGGGA